MLFASFFEAIPKMFGLKEGMVGHSSDQNHPPAKRGSAFHGTQLPRPVDFPTMPSTHLEDIEHHNSAVNAQRPGVASRNYSEQAFNSVGGHKPAYHHTHIPNLPN